jgi:hypothetical protein
MKRCYQSVSWESGAGFSLSGLSLGFDRRAEHVEGISPLLTKLGVAVVDFPIGVPDRQLTGEQPLLQFLKYDLVPQDRRRKGYPAALLYLLDGAMDQVPEGANPQAVVKRYDLGFVSEPVQKHHDPSHDLVTAWGPSGFAVHVRGARNISLLSQLHAAILAGDVAVMAPVGLGAPIGPVRLVLVSKMADNAKVELAAADEASEELLRAADATGIHALLARAGRRPLSLRPDWYDDAHDEVIFYLEPAEISQTNRGWFSLAELKAWANGSLSPVTRYTMLEHRIEPAFENWEARLAHGLARIGAVPRYAVRLAWLDHPGGTVAVRYRATRATEHILPSGNYAFHKIMAKHAVPLDYDKRAPVDAPVLSKLARGRF